MSRVHDRATMPEPVRLQLVEADLDSIDTKLDTTNERLSKILWAVVGLLISVCTGCIILAAQGIAS